MNFLSSSSSDFHIEEEKVDINSVRASLLGRCQDEMLTARDDVLCTRTSVFVEQPANNPGAALKAPFVLLAFTAGLWPKGFKVLQHILVAVGVVITGYILIGNIAVYRICGAISDHIADKLSPWLCYGPFQFNQTRHDMADIFRPILLVRTLFGFAQFSGFILMAYSVLVAQKSSKNALSLSVAITLLTRNQWIKLNLQILLSFVIWLVFIICDFIHTEDIIPADHYVIWMRIGNFVMWFYIATPCCIFAVMTYALESMMTACFHEIKEIQSGTIDDVIEIYQQVCNHVFGTVRALKYWFIVHWTTFGTVFIVDVAIGFKAVQTQFAEKQSEVLFWIFSFAFLSFVLHPFLYPSIRAAALTSTSGDMLEKLNFTERHSWRDNHPLKRRRDMNEFLMFANQTNCGFRIGRMTFTNGFALTSAFFGLFGLVLKLM